MNNEEKKELIKEIKNLERAKYITIQTINRAVFKIEKLLVGE